MTVMEFIAIIGFAGLFLSAGIAIGRLVERLLSFQNKNNRHKQSLNYGSYFYCLTEGANRLLGSTFSI